MADKFADMSPYNFVRNRPISSVDIGGKTDTYYLVSFNTKTHETTIRVVQDKSVSTNKVHYQFTAFTPGGKSKTVDIKEAVFHAFERKVAKAEEEKNGKKPDSYEGGSPGAPKGYMNDGGGGTREEGKSSPMGNARTPGAFSGGTRQSYGEDNEDYTSEGGRVSDESKYNDNDTMIVEVIPYGRVLAVRKSNFDKETEGHGSTTLTDKNGNPLKPKSKKDDDHYVPPGKEKKD